MCLLLGSLSCSIIHLSLYQFLNDFCLFLIPKTRPGADCGSDYKLLITKFRLKLKKVGKTTRPFRYDLNQIPYDYIVEVGNRFKGLDLMDRVPDELWTEVRDIIQEMDQDHPHGKEMQKSKMAVWGGLTNSCEKKRMKRKDKRKDIII